MHVFFCVYIYKGSQYISKILQWCVFDIIYRGKKNCLHIIHKSFYKSSILLQLLEYNTELLNFSLFFPRQYFFVVVVWKVVILYRT